MFKKSNKVISSMMFGLLMSASVMYSSATIAATPYFATTAAATAVATKLGYAKTNYISNGQAVYQKTPSSTIKGLLFISGDADTHIGGAWKAASTVKDLASDITRDGTYNENLTVRIGK